MWRGTPRRLVSLQAARQLLGLDPLRSASTNVPASSSLAAVLGVLQEHYKSGGEELVRAALHRVVQLDTTDADTALLAGLQTPVGVAEGDTATVLVSHTATQPRAAHAEEQTSCHLMVQLMRTYPNACDVRARCCRCIANLCQLDKAVSTQAPDDADVSLVNRLLREGALEQVLGTLILSDRLTPQAQCWAAMAACNLLCLSTRRPTAVEAETVLSEFITAVLAQEASHGVTPAWRRQCQVSHDDADAVNVSRHRDLALDAAIGALTACLTAEAADNAHGVGYNYEQVSYRAVDAVTRLLLRSSALLVRYACDAPRRPSVLHLPTASADQRETVTRLLPLLHKSWMALHYITGHAANLPLVFNALYEADLAVPTHNAGGGVMRPGALSAVCVAALFVSAEVTGMDAELAALRAQTEQFMLAALVDLTAARKDVPSERRGFDTATSETASDLLPTTAAHHVNAVLASGALRDLALAVIVRSTGSEHSGSNDPDAAHDAVAVTEACLVPWSADACGVLTKALQLLTHLAAGGEDERAVSHDTVAALQPLLRRSHAALRALAARYGAELDQLYQSSGSDESALAPAHRLLFVQHTAVVGQVYALLWGVLCDDRGRRGVAELDVRREVRALQELMQSVYQPSVERVRCAYEARAADAGSTRDAEGAKDGQWVPNAAAESTRLVESMGARLLAGLDAAARAERRSETNAPQDHTVHAVNA